MEQLVQPDRLRDRILLWAEEEVRAGTLPAKSGQMLEAVLFRGELPRGDVPALLGASERAARRVVSALLDRGVLFSESTRAPLFITFPAALAARWMPGLFPEQGRRRKGVRRQTPGRLSARLCLLKRIVAELLDTVQTVEARADDCWRALRILGNPSDVAVWALLTGGIAVVEREHNGRGSNTSHFDAMLVTLSRVLAVGVKWALRWLVNRSCDA